MQNNPSLGSMVERLGDRQRQALLAIRPGEERRAIDFHGSAAQSLCWATKSRPPLLARKLTNVGTIAWYYHTKAGLALQNALSDHNDTRDGGEGKPTAETRAGS